MSNLVKITGKMYNPVHGKHFYNKTFVMFGRLVIGETHYYFAGNGYSAKICLENFVRNVKRLLPKGIHGKITVSRG